MANKSVYELLLELQGRTNPSLIQAFAATKKGVVSLEKSVGQVNAALVAMDRRGATSARTMTSAFSQIAHGAKSYAAQVSSAWETAGHRMHRAMLPFHGLMSTLGRATGIGAGLAAIGGGFGIFEFLKGSVNESAKKELDITSLTTLLKSKSEGTALYDWLFEYTAHSQFRQDAVTGVMRQMLARGMTTGQAKTVLPQIGDVATGLGIRDPGDLSLGILEAFSGGNANLREINMMTQHGVPILKVLEQALGKDSEAIKKMISKRQVTFDMIETGLQKMTSQGGIFFGATKAGSATYTGRLSTLQDYFQAFRRSVGDPIRQGLTTMIGELVDGNVFGKLKDWADKTAAPAISDLFNTAETAFHKLSNTGELQQAWTSISDIFRQAGDDFGRIFGVNGGNSVDRITGGFHKLNEALKWVDDHFQQIALGAAGAFATMKAIALFNFGANLIGSINLVAKAFFGVRDAAVAARVAEVAASDSSILGWLTRLGPAGLLLGAGVLGARTIDKGADRRNAPAVIDFMRKFQAAHPGAANLIAPHRSDFPSSAAYQNAIEQWKEALQRGATSTDSAASALDRVSPAANAVVNAFRSIAAAGGNVNFQYGGLTAPRKPFWTPPDTSPQSKPATPMPYGGLSKPSAAVHITINQTNHIAGDVDHSKVSATLKRHSEDLSDTLRRMLNEDARLAYS